MGLLEILILSVGLAMDAFAVSVCKGLAIRKITLKECLICGLWFGLFQALMPTIGYLLSSLFEKWIDIVAPVFAFILLVLIGINMIREALSKKNDVEEESADLGFRTMLMLAIATSIDALAVGITFVAIPVEILNAGHIANTLFAAVIIGIITLIISAAGVKIGNLFGSRFKKGAQIAGGIILILLGIFSLFDK